MKYPNLVPKFTCKTSIHVTLYSEEISETGAPIVVLDKDFECNYQDKAKQILTAQKQIIEINGIALFDGDIAPNVPVITSGIVKIFGATREIYQGRKARNPDGTVNYTELEIK
ncbi:MAG: hypothetical protein SOZ71_04555 [Clostridium sp.]|nr:hypothetical protein [Clostridium sp.]